MADGGKFMKKNFLLFVLVSLCAFSACGKNGGKMSGELYGKNEITINCNGVSYNAHLAKNKSADAFFALLQKGDITLDMHDYGGFEKSGDLPSGQNIARNDTNFSATAGDFILFQGKIVAIYYGENNYNFTRLGHIDGATKTLMRNFLSAGEGNVKVTFSAKSVGGTIMNGKSKILVAYFSATGTTKKIAKAIADETGANVFEITPAAPYTSADLNWNDTKSRTTKECNDKSFRCPIKEDVLLENGEKFDIKNYDTIFLGFPIWWYNAPSIIQTFLESADFKDKKIALFCTSGSSGLGSTQSTLQKSASGAKWLGGKRFGAGDTNGAKKWAAEISDK